MSNLSNSGDNGKRAEQPNSSLAASFGQYIWQERTVLTSHDSRLLTNRFRRAGKALPVPDAVALYTAMKQTPVVSFIVQLQHLA